jgi:DNA repair protein RadD
VTYHEHQNRRDPSKPNTLKVSYLSGLKLVCSEFVCFEHEGYARKKAEKWWSDHASTLPIEIPAPTKVNDALLYCDDLAQPSHIVVKHGGQWPELVRCLFELSPVEET